MIKYGHVLSILLFLIVFWGCTQTSSSDDSLTLNENEAVTLVMNQPSLQKSHTFLLIDTTPYRIELTNETFYSIANNPAAQRNWQWAAVLPQFSAVNLLDMPALVTDDQRQVAIIQPSGQRGYVNADWLAPMGFVPAITTSQAVVFSHPSAGARTLSYLPALTLVAVDNKPIEEEFVSVYGILTRSTGSNTYSQVITGYLERSCLSINYADAQALMLYQRSFGMNSVDMKTTLLQAQALRPAFLSAYIKARLALFDEIVLPNVLNFSEINPAPYIQLVNDAVATYPLFAMPSTKSLLMQTLKANTVVQIKYVVQTHEGYWYFIPEKGWVLASNTRLNPADVVASLNVIEIFGMNLQHYLPL